jgi:WD40 repeat protein
MTTEPPQYDIRTGEITQEYDQHLGPVNTITFVDDNRRFVTTSDDKTIRAWDFDIPVTIKYIAEPYMHSMPAVTLHPSSTSKATPSPAFGNGISDTVISAHCREILCCSITGQPDPCLQHGQFPSGAE